MAPNTSLHVVDAGPELMGDLQAAAARAGNVRIHAAGAGAPPAPAGAFLLALEDTGPAGLERARALVGRAAATPVVVAAPDADSLAVRQLFRLGAHDVLAGPQDVASLATALRDLFTPAPAADRARGAVITLLKGCGGAGATTLALNLAALGAAGAPDAAPVSSAVLDLDLQFGDTDLALDLQPRTGLLDLLRGEARLDARLLDGLLTDHASGVRLLAPASTLTPLEAMPAALALDLLDLAAARFDRVFVDLPGAWTDWTLPLLARSELVVLVTSATVGGVLGARRVLDALRAAGVSPPRLLVLNRVAGVLETLDKPARVRRALDQPVDAAVPYDAKLARAAERGQLVVETCPRAPATRALRALRRTLETKLAAPSPGPALLEAAE